MVYRTKLLYLRRIILFATKYILQCFYKIILFVKRSIERALLDTYLNRIIQKVCRRRHMKRARKKHIMQMDLAEMEMMLIMG